MHVLNIFEYFTMTSSYLTDFFTALIRCTKIGSTQTSKSSCNCCYIIHQSQTNETNFTQWLNSPDLILLCSLLTAPWAMFVCVCAQADTVCYEAFCSIVVLGPVGGTRLGVRNGASQPNTENVLPALSNIFSNTLHSFSTCTTTSARTTLRLSVSYPCCSTSCSQKLYCSCKFWLMRKDFFYSAPSCCLWILRVRQLIWVIVPGCKFKYDLCI